MQKLEHRNRQLRFQYRWPTYHQLPPEYGEFLVELDAISLDILQWEIL